MKRFAMTTDKLMNFYKTVLRPVTSSVWQSSLTVDEFRRLEAIQKRAIMIKSGAKKQRILLFLHTLEQINTRLDTLTANYVPKYCYRLTAYANCCFDENWSFF